MPALATPSLFTWLDEAGVEHVLDVDVVNSAVDERTATLSDHVVETGATITDHVVLNPEQLTLELAVTQTPVTEQEGFAKSNTTLEVRPSQFVPGGFLALSSGVRSAIVDVFGLVQGGTSAKGSSFRVAAAPPTKAEVLQGGEARDRVNDVHDQLIRILQGGLLVTVSFKGRVYSDYALTRVTLTSNPGEAGLGRFSVDLRAFRTVTGEVVTLPNPADFRALPKAKKGNKPGKPPTPDPTKTKSWAAMAADLFRSDLEQDRRGS